MGQSGKIMVLKFPSRVGEGKTDAHASEMRSTSESLKTLVTDNAVITTWDQPWAREAVYRLLQPFVMLAPSAD